MNKWFVITVLVLSAVFIAVIARAEEVQYPCDFAKLHEFLQEYGVEYEEGLTIFEAAIPDTTEGNTSGKVVFMSGYGKAGIGCGIVHLSEEGDPIVGYFVYYFPEFDSFAVTNIVTGLSEEMSREEACRFVRMWLGRYYTEVGLPT